MTVEERARSYVAKMPVSISGSGGHAAAFEVAAVLMRGFSLDWSAAERIMTEWSGRCSPPWSEREIHHKLRQAAAAARPEGYLLRDGERSERPSNWTAPAAPARKQKAEYDPEKLAEVARGKGEVDLVWLANRSQADPAELDSAGFLRMMFREGERVIVFAEERSQGQAVWPLEGIPAVGEKGMWFLIQPVDGKYHANPRNEGKPSRRSEEAVTEWRYLLLESDDAPAGTWLAAVARMKKVAAIYSSGGRSVHALIKVDQRSKAGWDALRDRVLGKDFGRLGVDEKAASAVRLSRLPQQLRREKNGWQKLLFVRSYPGAETIEELPVVRDVESIWMERGRRALWAADLAGMQAAQRGLFYYGRVREELQRAGVELGEAMDELRRKIDKGRVSL